MSEFRIYAVRIFSYQWAQSLAFYKETIGLELEYENPEIGWAQFKIGDAYIGLESCDKNDPEAESLVGRFVGLSLQVDDIDAVYDSLTEKGVVFTSPPTTQPWGGVLAHFKDPDGNIVTLLGSSN